MHASLPTTPLAVKLSKLRARGKVSLFPGRGRCAYSAPRDDRLTGYADPPIRVRNDHEDDGMRTASRSGGTGFPPAKAQGGVSDYHGRQCSPPPGGLTGTKLIRLVDLRVWFAAHELDARRCRVERDFTPTSAPANFKKLTGLSIKRIKDSFRRLETARLLSWSETALGFPESTEVLPWTDSDDFRAFLDRIPNPARKVPVPRRTLRLLPEVPALP